LKIQHVFTFREPPGFFCLLGVRAAACSSWHTASILCFLKMSNTRQSLIKDAVRVLLTRIAAEKELPFTLRVPNAETRAAMKEADEIARNHSARFSSAEELFASLEKDSGRH
jgi:hypothetical protein